MGDTAKRNKEGESEEKKKEKGKERREANGGGKERRMMVERVQGKVKSGREDEGKEGKQRKKKRLYRRIVLECRQDRKEKKICF